MPVKRPIRILHVVGRMNRGGVETWLMHVLRNVDRDRYRMDFLAHVNKESAYDGELQQHGSRLHHCEPHNPIRYASKFRAMMQEQGPYDVVHSHVHHFSGYVLKLADASGVPIRIAHSHSDTLLPDERATAARRAYLKLGRYWIHNYATAMLAVSEPSALALYGTQWRQDERVKVLQLGIDLSRFREPFDRGAVRASLGISPDALVLGHVGRFEPQKNHRFLLNVAAEATRINKRVRLLLVGDGSLMQATMRMARNMGISAIFAGSRPNVPELMMAAMDLFIFPSESEGLGLVAVEAQAAGLPCLLSDRIPARGIWRPEVVSVLDLTDPRQWATAALAAAGRRQPPRTIDCPFDVRKSLAGLLDIYDFDHARLLQV
jgi:glycosyltransferase involved in cell wall biosynthesis